MKVRSYVVSVVEKAKAESQKLGTEMRLGVVSGVTTAMVVAPNICAYAAEDVSGGSNLLSGEVLSAITNGFSSLAITATAVVSMAVIAGVSVIGLSAAAKYAMKKFKGVLSQAA